MTFSDAVFLGALRVKLKEYHTSTDNILIKNSLKIRKKLYVGYFASSTIKIQYEILPITMELYFQIILCKMSLQVVK